MRNKLKNIGVIAAITAKNSDLAIQYVNACVKGGIRGIEINYSTPNINFIVQKVKELYPEIILGVAEIPDFVLAQEVIENGVNYITTPYNDKYISMACERIDDLIYIPGCMTLSEINEAKRRGDEIVKLYPAEMLNPKYISIINSVIRFVDVMPSGGINDKNIEEWFKNGAHCVVVGRYLLENDDIEEIEKKAMNLMSKFNEIKGSII